jgi:cytochrome bd-type quinol oxidase subunit 2
MANWIRKLLLVITVLCVVVVLIAPSVDLPDTTLRAWQHAVNVMLALALLAVILLLCVNALNSSWRQEGPPAARPILSVHPWLCTFLC